MSAAHKLSTISFDKLVQDVSVKMEKVTGNKFGPKQVPMVQSRLKRRMQQLKLAEPAEYLAYLNEHSVSEIGELTSLLTNHHTFFFREFQHFDWLDANLAMLADKARKRGDKIIHIWSAACSRGQEVWSLASFLDVNLKAKYPDVSWRIHGTDIDPQSVAFSQNGVYAWEEVKKIPFQFLTGNFMRGKNEIAAYAKAGNHLRDKCTFGVLNLLEFTERSLPRTEYDVIFCRNVFIYFDHPTIKAITTNFRKFMAPDSILFLGLSESLQGIVDDMKLVGASVYSQRNQKAEWLDRLDQEFNARVNSVGSRAEIIRVLCVDDSPSILTILKKALTREYGFEVIGTAANGLEAQKLVRELKPDVMTLDIHMPEMDGITYLTKSWNSSHPPVVMVSSASREDYATTSACFRAGASDFVEKPTLANFKECADEIRSKLQAGLKARKGAVDLTSLREFSKEFSFKDIQNKELWIFAAPASRERVLKLVEQLPSPFPTIHLFLSGERNVVEPLLSQAIPISLHGKIIPHHEADSQLTQASGKRILAFVCSDSKWTKVASAASEMKVIVEEGPQTSQSNVYDVSPFTSFPYLALKYFLD